MKQKIKKKLTINLILKHSSLQIIDETQRLMEVFQREMVKKNFLERVKVLRMRQFEYKKQVDEWFNILFKIMTKDIGILQKKFVIDYFKK